MALSEGSPQSMRLAEIDLLFRFWLDKTGILIGRKQFPAL